MSSPDSSRAPVSAGRLGADGEGVSERLGTHRQLLSRLTRSEALTGRDIDAGYAQVTELMTTLLRVERDSVWRFDASGSQLHVDELTRVEQSLRRSGENLRIVLGAAPVALVLTRLKDQHVVLANERCAALFGVPLEEVVGQRTRDFYAVPEERDRMVEQLLARGYLDSHLVKLKKRGGEEFWAEISGRIVELDGQRCSLVGVHDVTAQKNLEEQLRELATRDSLTGAANRRHFVELLERERGRCQRSGGKLSLCMLDADHFKRVNDGYGHVAGDHVLQAIAAAAQSQLRTADVLGRLGGEEFGIMLPDTDLGGAAVLAERVRAAVARARVPSGNAREIEVTISIGVAQLQGDEPFESLLQRADRALYVAKDRGRNCVQS